MQVGKVFALAEHPTLMPAEPMKQMMHCCAGVEVYEMILRTRRLCHCGGWEMVGSW